jgi:HB1, ASXL, restriction endonuclease HTH domain
MTKRKSKTSTTETSAHASNGKAVEVKTPVKPPQQARGKIVPATSSAEAPATAPEASSAPPAKERAKSGKLSALDAAAKILEEMGQPMTCQEMIDAMAKKGYWSSPGGRTPAATLYSAILRELKTKGDACRFVKTERGKFARQ